MRLVMSLCRASHKQRALVWCRYEALAADVMQLQGMISGSMIPNNLTLRLGDGTDGTDAFLKEGVT